MFHYFAVLLEVYAENSGSKVVEEGRGETLEKDLGGGSTQNQLICLQTQFLSVFSHLPW